MRTKAALSLLAVSLVLSGCAASHAAPAAATSMMTFNPRVLPSLNTPPSGARTGRVEAAVGFNAKGFGSTKIKVSEDPLLAATTDTVYWYVDAGMLNIEFANQALNAYVACQQQVCYFAPPSSVPKGVYAYTIRVEDHPKHGDKKLDPDLDIRY